ncbi:MAG TPA: RNA polymerase sigma factor [Paludibacteraceae bacterium]|nr:RNA polymerase sigma factor [Paludibacteraceae bacterium]HQO47874.1 RNA polymerase sigma factor [Paludibacteraceae bacterium]
MIEKDQKKLLEQFQNEATKAAAFSELVKTSHEKLYWHIRRIVLNHDDADDILQNTYMKAWNSLSSFRGESQITTWLYRIATNKCLTFLTKERMKNITSSLDAEDILLRKMEGDAYFNGDEAQKLLQEAILTLPEKQRIVFNMRYFQEMSYEKMAEILNTSVGALKASYHYAVKKVELFLKEN